MRISDWSSDVCSSDLPALSDNVEAGTKWQTSIGLLTAAVFRSQTQDEIVPASSVGGRTSYRNAGRTRSDGAELAWRAQFAGHAKAYLAYAWLDDSYRDSVTDAIRAGNRIPSTARQTAQPKPPWAPPPS